MKNAVWCLFIACAAVCGQTSPDNAAAASLRNRLLTLDLLKPVKVMKVIRLAPTAVVAPSGICAIPLLNAIPPGTSDKMHVVNPPAPSSGDTVQVPAPACGEAL